MTSSDNASLLRFAIFGNAVRHGVSTRRGGVSAPPFSSLNLGRRVGDAPEAVTQNRGIFLQQLGLQPEQVFSPSQVHGDSVVVVGEQDAGRGVYGDLRPPIEADAALTQAQGLALLLISADCALLLLQDPAQGVVGAAHAGWRGSVAGVAGKTVAEMARAFGTKPADVRVGIAPAIGPCCYEVDGPVLEPVRQRFPQWEQQVVRPGRPGHGYLDVQELNRLQLLQAGVPDGNIEVLRMCTSCNNEQFFSERREGRPSGRLGAAIALQSAH